MYEMKKDQLTKQPSMTQAKMDMFFEIRYVMESKMGQRMMDQLRPDNETSNEMSTFFFCKVFY